MKIKRYQQRISQYRQNRIFSVDQKRIYQELDGDDRGEGTSPDSVESKSFWSEIWDNEIKHNENAQWLRKLNDEDRSVQENIVITREMVKMQCRKIPTDGTRSVRWDS